MPAVFERTMDIVDHVVCRLKLFLYIGYARSAYKNFDLRYLM